MAADLFVAAADESSPYAEEALASLLASFPAAAARTDEWAPVVRELGRSLQSAHAALVEAATALSDRENELIEAQRDREEASELLRQELSALRMVVGAVFGHDSLTAMGLDREIPEEPLALVRMAGEVRDGLSRLSGFEALRSGMALSPRMYEASLSSALHTLTSAMATLRNAARARRNADAVYERAGDLYRARGNEAANALERLLRRKQG